MNSSFTPPPKQSLPILQRLIVAYKLWHEYVPHLHKTSRYTLGGKVDQLLIETIEAIVEASITQKSRKLPYLKYAVRKLDLVKFFLQVLWEIKAMETSHYAKLSEHIQEVGRQLGAWTAKIERETPAR